MLKARKTPAPTSVRIRKMFGLEKRANQYCDRSVSMWEAAGRAVEKIQG